MVTKLSIFDIREQFKDEDCCYFRSNVNVSWYLYESSKCSLFQKTS